MRNLKTVIKVAALLVVLNGLAACGTSTGWTVQFGVQPITAVDNRQQLIKSNGGAILAKAEKDRY